MVTGGRETLIQSEQRVKVPTGKLVLVIVEMYATQRKEMLELASNLAGCIVETYDDRDLMTKDILGTYVNKRLMLAAMRTDIKRQYPEISKTLSEIFGLFLFGEKL